MKALFLYLLVLIFGVSVFAAESPRQQINFNREWKFQLGDHVGAAAVNFADASWEAIGLPHSFSLPYFASPKFYTGYGWYRKHFAVPTAWSGKKLFLEFDGAFQDAEIFLNGRRLAEHKGGYTGFSVDITDAVKTGDNVVAVRLNNLWNAQLAPRAGEHTFSGGIYRNVRLVVAAPLHVTWYGTCVTTPEVSQAAGTVNVRTEVRNDGAADKLCRLQTDILDPDGKTVASLKSTQAIAAGTTFTFDQTSRPIPQPQLWHPEHPLLYTAVSKVFDGSRCADNYTTTFGFRWFKFTADQGFFLNGEHYYFKGADAHQDHAGWGDAVADSGFYRDVKMIKDAGFDFIRGSHYPHAPTFAEACDRLGVLFWSENCFWGTGNFQNPWGSVAYPPEPANQPGFEQSVRDSLRDMIRINRNHPSIVVWSQCNEVYFTDQSTLPKVRTLLKELTAYAHELDPSRPVGIGGCQRGNIDKCGDIAGYNGDGAQEQEFINPGIPSVVTEYGSTMGNRPGNYEPGWGALPYTPGADRKVIGSWRLPWRSGEVLWCAFDHGSIAGQSFGAMGMVDYFRLPKRQWYWYRNEYRHIPPPAWPVGGTPAALRLTASTTTLKSVDGTQDAQLIVQVLDAHGTPLSNSPPVTLTVVSGPGQFPTGRSITFAPDSDIAIRDGEAAMEFRSYYAGQSVIRASSPGLQDAMIKITSLGKPKYVPGVTPPVAARPYVRYDDPSGFSTSPEASVFGLNNPTRVSSEAPGHSGRLANDGNPATCWQAATGDTNAWWQVDLERIVTVRQVQLTFPVAGNWRYKIEISDDGASHWWLVTDQPQTAGTLGVRNDPVQPGARGRFLRVNFTAQPAGQPAALAELEAVGSVEVQ